MWVLNSKRLRLYLWSLCHHNYSCCSLLSNFQTSFIWIWSCPALFDSVVSLVGRPRQENWKGSLLTIPGALSRRCRMEVIMQRRVSAAVCRKCGNWRKREVWAQQKEKPWGLWIQWDKALACSFSTSYCRFHNCSGIGSFLKGFLPPLDPSWHQTPNSCQQSNACWEQKHRLRLIRLRFGVGLGLLV